MKNYIDEKIEMVEEINKLTISKKISFVLTFFNCFLTGVIVMKYGISLYSILITFITTIICYNSIRIIEINKCSSYINGRVDAYNDLADFNREQIGKV